MPADSVKKRGYPWITKVDGKQVSLRLMNRDDLDRAVAFARELPAKDLMFLTIDITDPEAMAEYLEAAAKGQAITVLAELDSKFVGYGSLSISQPAWTHHLGEIRLLVSSEMRGKGLGRVLASEILHLAHEKGLRKLIARMAVEQKGAAQVFERLGFRTEALLTDFVMDRNGLTHDLIVMTYDVTGLTE